MSRRTYRFYTLDVFTDRTFGGNPLAVIPDARGLNDEEMQALTREFNLSETVFVFPPDDPAHTARARIFTPGRELAFAGHPTIGTALLLAMARVVPLTDRETQVILEEGIGPVPVVVSLEQGAPRTACLVVSPPELRRDGPDVPDASALAQMLGLEADDVVTRAPLAPAAGSCGTPFLLVPLRSRDAVSRSRLQREAFDRTLAGAWAREVFVFDASAVESGDAIRARMFAPDLGIGEDPATGSAAAVLAGYLAAAALASGSEPVQRTERGFAWRVEQGVEMGRPSELELSAEVSGGALRAVSVGGRAVLVSEGTIQLP